MTSPHPPPINTQHIPFGEELYKLHASYPHLIVSICIYHVEINLNKIYLTQHIPKFLDTVRAKIRLHLSGMQI